MSSKRWKKLAALYPLLRANPISAFILRQEIEVQKATFSPIYNESFAIVGDVGVGRGHSLYLQPEGATLKIAIDNCTKMILLDSTRYKDTCFLAGDALNLPFQPESFDLLLCVGLSEYISNIEHLLSQLHLMLKPGRYLFLTSSPQNALTFLRKFMGPKLYPRTADEFKSIIKNNDFKIIHQGSTFSQHQYLLKKY